MPSTPDYNATWIPTDEKLPKQRMFCWISIPNIEIPDDYLILPAFLILRHKKFKILGTDHTFVPVSKVASWTYIPYPYPPNEWSPNALSLNVQTKEE